MTETLSHPPETNKTPQGLGSLALDRLPNTGLGLEGVEPKQLFEGNEQSELLNKVGEWFKKNKKSIPQIGLYVDMTRPNSPETQTTTIEDAPDTDKQLFGVELSPEVIKLCDAILHDSATDPELKNKDVRFVFERTGALTHDEDDDYHTDTRQIYWDENGNRVGYDSARSRSKYMVYVDRPGTVIIHGKVNPAITHQESIAQAQLYGLDEEGLTTTEKGTSEPIVSQLLPNTIYKVAVGDLVHTPPRHEDGLLITASFNK